MPEHSLNTEQKRATEIQFTLIVQFSLVWLCSRKLNVYCKNGSKYHRTIFSLSMSRLSHGNEGCWWTFFIIVFLKEINVDIQWWEVSWRHLRVWQWLGNTSMVQIHQQMDFLLQISFAFQVAVLWTNWWLLLVLRDKHGSASLFFELVLFLYNRDSSDTVPKSLLNCSYNLSSCHTNTHTHKNIKAILVSLPCTFPLIVFC